MNCPICDGYNVIRLPLHKKADDQTRFYNCLDCYVIIRAYDPADNGGTQFTNKILHYEMPWYSVDEYKRFLKLKAFW